MKNYCRLRRSLHNCLFTRLTLFKKIYKMIAKDFSKQQALVADPRAIQPISFTGNLDWPGITIFFILEEVK